MIKTIIIIGLATLIMLWVNLWISVRIIAYLKGKGENASLFTNSIYVKGKIFRYLPLYKRISKETDGKVGGLYYAFYGSFVLILLFLMMGIILIS